MSVKEIQASSNEKLILQFARHFYDGTKTSSKQEQQILKELAKRKIINLEEMKTLYKQCAL